MGAIPGLLGMGGGAGGTSFANPGMANLMPVTNSGEIQGAQAGVQNSMQSQQALLQALQGQQGLQNQSQVYNQMQGVASGTGPNPAQAQYQQNIQQLGGQQAGAMASVRGISPALQARLIAQQGSSAMQNAAGQGAANLASQQLGAMGAAGNMANTMAGNQVNQTNSNAAAQLQGQQNLLNAAGQSNASIAGMQNQINASNTSMANTQMGGQQKGIGGLFNASGIMGQSSSPGIAKATGGSMGSAIGGGIGMAEGGDVESSAPAGPQSFLGRFMSGIPQAPIEQAQTVPIEPSPQPDSGGGGLASLAPMAMMAAAGGGQVPALVSPGERYLPPSAVNQVMHGKSPMQAGEQIPGKPKVAGNSYANDTVKKTLKSGGIVIPNSIMQSKDPAGAAKDFIANIIAKRRRS